MFESHVDDVIKVNDVLFVDDQSGRGVFDACGEDIDVAGAA